MLEGKRWVPSRGASDEALTKLVDVSPLSLPESYLACLTESNGGEGPLGVQPFWLLLYPAEEVTEIETEGSYHEFFPGLFVIGSNGAGEAVALRTDKDGEARVVFFDMTNSDLDESVVVLANSFDELLGLIENRQV